MFVIGRAELFNLGDQHLFELDFHVLDLVATGATELDGNFLDVLAGTASFKKLGRCLIQLMNEVEGAVIDTFRRRTAHRTGRTGGRLFDLVVVMDDLNPFLVFFVC